MSQASRTATAPSDVEEAVQIYRAYLVEIVCNEEGFGTIVTKVNPGDIHVERTSSRRIKRKAIRPPV